MSATGIKAGRAFVSIEAIDNTGRVLRRVSASMNRFASEIGSVGRRMLTVSTLAAAPFGFALKTFADFDDQMQKVKAVTQATEDQLRALTEQAKELGRTTSFTAVDVAGVDVELGKAGFRPEEIQQQVPHVLNLARATDTDAAATAGIVAATLRQFHLEAAETERVADALTATANGTFNTLEQLADSLRYAGPVAEQFNMSLEDTLAVLGALGNIGIQGSMAGTVLRNLELRAASLQDEFRKIGVEPLDPDGNLRNLVDLLADIDAATREMGTGERGAVLNRLFGVRSITGGAALSGNVGSVEALAEQIRGSGGVARRTANEMDQGIGGALRRFASALEGVRIEIGDAIKFLGQYVDRLANGLNTAVQWVQTHQNLVVGLAAVIGVVAAAGAGLIGLSVAIKAAAFALGPLIAVLGLLRTALVAIPALVGLIISPMGLLTVAIGTLLTQALSLTSGWSQGWHNIFSTFRVAWGGILDRLRSGDLQGAADAAAAGLKAVWAEALASLTSIWSTFKAAVAESWIGLMHTLRQQLIELQTGIADWLLKKAGEEGVIGSAARLLVGADLRGGAAEEARAENRRMSEARLSELDSATAALMQTLHEDLQRERDAAREEAEAAKRRLEELLAAPAEERLAETQSPGTVAEEAARAAQQVRSTAADMAAGPLGAGIHDALEKGSVEAARRAFENNQQLQMLGQIAGATNAAAGGIDEVVELLNEMRLQFEGA